MHKVSLLCVDLICLVCATFLSLILRDNLSVSPERMLGILPYTIASILSGAAFFTIVGINRGIWRFASLPDFMRVAGAVVLTVAGAMAIGFAVDRLEAVPRAVPIMQAVLAIVFMTAARVAARLRHAQRTRIPTGEIAEAFRGETVLVLGISWVTDLFLRSVRELGSHHVSVAGIIGSKEQQTGRLFQDCPVLGTPEELQDILRDLDTHGVYVDRIVVTTPLHHLSLETREALYHIETTTTISVDYFGERIGLLRAPTEQEEVPVHLSESGCANELHFTLCDVAASSALNRWYWGFKRLLDIAMSIAAIIVASPLFLLTTLLVAFDVGTPLLFRQQRPGRYGHRFKVYKFRTMKAAHDKNGRRLPDEKRTSAIGHFIRRTRLDELPQLFNILAGQMSFIGPRPLLPIDQAKEQSARLAVRPGLSGWAQVNGGRELTIADKAAMDIWYVYNASFILDMKIILATLYMVVFGERPNPRVVKDAWQYLRKLAAPRALTSSEQNSLTQSSLSTPTPLFSNTPL